MAFAEFAVLKIDLVVRGRSGNKPLARTSAEAVL
jgi:hypothetical protein